MSHKQLRTTRAQQSAFWALIEILGSLKIAMVLLMVLLVAIATATFLESKRDAGAAWQYVYGAPWFAGWLLVLCLNLAASAASRWPWRQRHVGFVVTHAGIILLLAGALIGRMTGFEANVRLRAGEPPTARVVRGKESVLQLSSPVTGQSYVYPLRVDERLNQSDALRIPIPDSDWRVEISSYTAALQPELRLASSSEAAAASDSATGPAVRVALRSARMGQAFEAIVLASPEAAQRLSLGPLTIALDKPRPASVSTARPPVTAPPSIADATLRLWVSKDGAAEYSVERAGRVVRVGRAAVGEDFSLGLADWQATVRQAFARGEASLAWRGPAQESAPAPVFSGIVPPGATAEGILVQLVDGGSVEKRSETEWIAWGSRREIFLGGNFSRVGFGPRTEVLPFGIALDRMEVPQDEGSTRAADYIAHVRFEPGGGAPPVHAIAQMNQPANFPGGWWRSTLGRNYKFSQAGYNPQEPDATVLQVLYDPGWPAKWIGSLGICLGIALMFYWKPGEPKEEDKNPTLR